MTEIAAPLADIRFALAAQGGLDTVLALPGCEALSGELIDAILEQAARFATEVLAPLNQPGDRQGSRLVDGVVVTPDGFRQAYADFAAGGWVGLTAAPEFGGQGLPHLLAAAVSEIWSSANMAFSLCPMLSQSAIFALTIHGGDRLRRLYLDKLVSGQWTGTMDLTESHAGSDVGALKTKALPDGDHYRIVGEKIFITYGDHDLAENILHMVLARTPGAPAGVRGISLFLVPKFLVDDDGVPGALNDLRCVSLEHKMGINGSPTWVMSFGEGGGVDGGGGAVGYLLGEENWGIEYMFTMMNNARLAIGVEGVGVAERAYQHARDYAAERVQSRAIGGADSSDSVTIDNHPDVRRMLLSMRVQTEAMRALALYAAAQLDAAKRHPDEAQRKDAQARVDLLIPVVKAWSTDTAIDVTNTGIQVLGGAGYIEESGAAQYLRDVRITAIYEGTNGIQALDLVGRKVARDRGAAVQALIADMRTTVPAGQDGDDMGVIRDALSDGIDAWSEATDWIVETCPEAPEVAAAGAVPYLKLMGIVAGGWLMARAARTAAKRLEKGDDSPFYPEKMVSARFYADHILVQAPALAATVTRGWTAVGRFRDGGSDNMG